MSVRWSTRSARQVDQAAGPAAMASASVSARRISSVSASWSTAASRSRRVAGSARSRPVARPIRVRCSRTRSGDRAAVRGVEAEVAGGRLGERSALGSVVPLPGDLPEIVEQGGDQEQVRAGPREAGSVGASMTVSMR